MTRNQILVGLNYSIWPGLGSLVGWDHRRVIFSIVCLLARRNPMPMRERPGRRGSARARPASMASVGQTLAPAVVRWKLGAG